MTAGVETPAGARESVKRDVDTTRAFAEDYVKKNPGLSLADVVEHVQAPDRPIEFVSKAVMQLLTARRLRLSRDLRVFPR